MIFIFWFGHIQPFMFVVVILFRSSSSLSYFFGQVPSFMFFGVIFSVMYKFFGHIHSVWFGQKIVPHKNWMFCNNCFNGKYNATRTWVWSFVVWRPLDILVHAARNFLMVPGKKLKSISHFWLGPERIVFLSLTRIDGYVVAIMNQLGETHLQLKKSKAGTYFFSLKMSLFLKTV